MEAWTPVQQRLADILKKKGIGPEASKSLKPEELNEVEDLLREPSVNLTTKATFLTALLTLPPNDSEKTLIEKIRNSPDQYLPVELVGFVSLKENSPFYRLIRKVISNTNLTEDESKEGMKFFFDPTQPEYLKGAFLEAERLKRETFIENKVFFECMWKEIDHTSLSIPLLLDIADSYDGCNRTRHFSVFVAALIASLGYPVYLHGVDSVAPKEAVTSHQILKTAGKNPLKATEAVVRDILNPEIGWGYIDQQIFFPQLYLLKKMRKEMVKRPFLATFEKLLQPLMATNGNLIVTGYTHSHYRNELVNQLKNQGKCKQALVLKGVEGSTQISMARDTVSIHFNGEEIVDSSVHPDEFGLSVFNSSRDLTITPQISLQEGVEALRDAEGFAKENIIYTAAVILTSFDLEDKGSIVEKLRASIRSGKAYQHWANGAVGK